MKRVGVGIGVLFFFSAQVVAGQVSITSVQVLTDDLKPIDGAIVQLTSDSDEVVCVTDTAGQSPWVEFDPSLSFSMTLGDKAVPQGLALGLVEHLPPLLARDPNVDYHEATLSRTQPIARSVFVEGLPDQVNNIYPPDGKYPHWIVAVPRGAAYRFTIGIAPLLDTVLIDEYLEYRGREPGEEYVRGIACVVPNLQLGSSAVYFGIRLLGDLEGGCVVDAINFVDSGRFMIAGGPPLSAQVVVVDDDMAVVRVSGRVRKGQLALLLREPGAPGRVLLQEDEPPTIVVPTNAGQGVEFVMTAPDDPALPGVFLIPGTVGDCEPDDPTPENWTCDIQWPDPDGECHGPPAPGEKACSMVRTRSGRICRGAGSVIEGVRAFTTKLKASVAIGGDEGPGGPTLKSSGAFEYGWESMEVWREQWTAQGPNGQCKRYYVFYLFCAQEFTVPTHVIIPDIDGGTTVDPCAGTRTIPATCKDVLFTDSTCNR